MGLKAEKINGDKKAQGGSVKETSGMFKDAHSAGIKTTAPMDGKGMQNVGGSPAVKKTDEPIKGKNFTHESPKHPTPHTFKR